MESNNDFDQLANALNNETKKQYKDKNAMKTLLLISSKSYVSKTYNYELLNLFTSFFASLYFTTRSFYFSDNSFLLLSGIIASAVWIFMLIYSWAGIRKLSMIKTSEDPIITSIGKIVSSIKHYTIQKKIYLWMAPLTILSFFPIPLFEFHKLDLMAVTNHKFIIFLVCLFIVSVLAAIYLSKIFWEKKYNEPLENANQILKELLD